MTVTPWSPLASGLLTGKYSKAGSGEKRLEKTSFVELSERNLRIVKTVEEVASARGASMAQVALAWAQQSGKMIPIIGARTVKQLDDNLGAVSIALSEQERHKLDEASRIDLGFPLEFLNRKVMGDATVRTALHGGTFERIIKNA
jgi:aryl-alcohol dehydrogenase-like predicted oxidoreductase